MTNPTKIRHSRTAGNKPASLLTGELAINEMDRALYYSDPTFGVTDLLASQASLHAVTNLIFNGAMEIDQVNVGAAVTGVGVSSPVYAIDMVKLVNAGATRFTTQQVADAPAGLVNSVKFTVTTANATPGATDNTRLQFPVEGTLLQRLVWGTASAQNVVVGFWFKAFRAGTYALTLTNDVPNRSYATSFTLNASNTWQYFSFSIPGDIAGTWQTGGALALVANIWIMAGTSFTGGSLNAWSASSGNTGGLTITNGVQSTSDAFQVTGVSLHSGSIPSSVARSSTLQLPFPQMFQACRRYYSKSWNYATAPGTITTTGQLLCNFFPYAQSAGSRATLYVSFSMPMLATPTITAYSPASGSSGNIRDLSTSVDVAPTLTVGQWGFTAWAAGTSSTNQIASFSMHWTADARM